MEDLPEEALRQILSNEAQFDNRNPPVWRINNQAGAASLLNTNGIKEYYVSEKFIYILFDAVAPRLLELGVILNEEQLNMMLALAQDTSEPSPWLLNPEQKASLLNSTQEFPPLGNSYGVQHTIGDRRFFASKENGSITAQEQSSSILLDKAAIILSSHHPVETDGGVEFEALNPEDARIVITAASTVLGSSYTEKGTQLTKGRVSFTDPKAAQILLQAMRDQSERNK